MKQFYVIGFLMLMVCNFALAQKTQHTSFPEMPIDENTKLVTYRKVVQQTGNSEVLYERALKWANTYYSNPTIVITKADKNNKVIECVSNIKISSLAKDGKTWTAAGFVYYTLSIEAKDNRYRYTITDIHKRESARFPIEKWLDNLPIEGDVSESAGQHDLLCDIVMQSPDMIFVENNANAPKIIRIICKVFACSIW